MKKTILSLALVASALFASGQAIPGLSATAAYDDFATTDSYGMETEDTKWDDVTKAPVVGEKAFKGIVWGTKAGVASSTRLGDGKISYAITQDTGAYEPFVVLFGSYADGASEKFYSLDLSNDANLSFSIKNAGTKTVRVSVQVRDVDNNTLVYRSGAATAIQDDSWQYQLGFVQGETTPLAPSATGNFTYDLKTAIVGSGPNSTTISPSIAFNYAKVTMVLITVVNHANTNAPSPNPRYNYAPFAITDYPIEISDFKLGDVSTITSVEDNFLAANNNQVVSVYDMMGKFVATGKLKELGLESGKLYVVKSGNKSRKIVMN
jgi:hypothetical protein